MSDEWSWPYTDNFTGPYWSDGKFQGSVPNGEKQPKNRQDRNSRAHDAAFALCGDLDCLDRADRQYYDDSRTFIDWQPRWIGATPLYTNWLPRQIYRLVVGEKYWKGEYYMNGKEYLGSNPNAAVGGQQNFGVFGGQYSVTPTITTYANAPTSYGGTINQNIPLAQQFMNLKKTGSVSGSNNATPASVDSPVMTNNNPTTNIPLPSPMPISKNTNVTQQVAVDSNFGTSSPRYYGDNSAGMFSKLNWAIKKNRKRGKRGRKTNKIYIM